MMNENDFRQEMVIFYHACQVPTAMIERIMTENAELISRYLMATPELVARKLYQQTFQQTL